MKNVESAGISGLPSSCLMPCHLSPVCRYIPQVEVEVGRPSSTPPSGTKRRRQKPLTKRDIESLGIRQRSCQRLALPERRTSRDFGMRMPPFSRQSHQPQNANRDLASPDLSERRAALGSSIRIIVPPFIRKPRNTPFYKLESGHPRKIDSRCLLCVVGPPDFREVTGWEVY